MHQTKQTRRKNQLQTKHRIYKGFNVVNHFRKYLLVANTVRCGREYALLISWPCDHLSCNNNYLSDKSPKDWSTNPFDGYTLDNGKTTNFARCCGALKCPKIWNMAFLRSIPIKTTSTRVKFRFVSFHLKHTEKRMRFSTLDRQPNGIYDADWIICGGSLCSTSLFILGSFALCTKIRNLN